MEYEFPSHLKLGKRDEKKIERKLKKILRYLLYFLLGYLGGIVVFKIINLIK